MGVGTSYRRGRAPVEGEHGVALRPLTGSVSVAVPQNGDAQRRNVGPGESRGDGLTGSPVGFEDGTRRDDAVLARRQAAMNCSDG